MGAKDVSEGFSARPVSLTAPRFLKQVLRTETVRLESGYDGLGETHHFVALETVANHCWLVHGEEICVVSRS